MTHKACAVIMIEHVEILNHVLYNVLHMVHLATSTHISTNMHDIIMQLCTGAHMYCPNMLRLANIQIVF